MKQLTNSDVAILELKESRSFSYTMNNKRTKAKLLKGAKREKNLDVEIKSGCVNLRFNDGSYCEVILPLLNHWHEKVGSDIFLNDHKIHIISIEKGIDKSNKHSDTLVKIMYSEQRITLHAYNTTQNLMVQGTICEEFAVSCLEPFFRGQIESALIKISDFNKAVVEQLSTKAFSQSSNSFGCPMCELKLKTHSD